jgi:hypothetical protein
MTAICHANRRQFCSEVPAPNPFPGTTALAHH